jgi:hypothetical protein
MNTPVVLVIFNRPDTTQLVLKAIRQVQPKKLFVIADGPRADRAGEVEQCNAARSVIEQVNWDCEVLTNYSAVNLGCARRVSSGLDWVFQQVEEAIILEDDCVPNPTFFTFCEELLERYRADDRVSSISAQKFCPLYPIEESYYFSRYPHCWGWATWRRAWQNFDFEMRHWQVVKEQGLLKNMLEDDRAAKVWAKIFEATYTNQISSWAYRWVLCCWLQNSLSIHPKLSLVQNIGFGQDATHTQQKLPFADYQTKLIEFPLKHPPFIVRHTQIDQYLQHNVFDLPLIHRFYLKLKKLLESIQGIQFPPVQVTKRTVL